MIHWLFFGEPTMWNWGSIENNYCRQSKPWLIWNNHGKGQVTLGHYYHVAWMLIIQPVLIINTQVVVHLFIMRNALTEPIRSYQKIFTKKSSFWNNRNYQKQRITLYVILKLLLNKDLLFDNQRLEIKDFLELISFKSADPFSCSQVDHPLIIIHDSSMDNHPWFMHDSSMAYGSLAENHSMIIAWFPWALDDVMDDHPWWACYGRWIFIVESWMTSWTEFHERKRSHK